MSRSSISRSTLTSPSMSMGWSSAMIILSAIVYGYFDDDQGALVAFFGDFHLPFQVGDLRLDRPQPFAFPVRGFTDAYAVVVHDDRNMLVLFHELQGRYRRQRMLEDVLQQFLDDAIEVIQHPHGMLAGIFKADDDELQLDPAGKVDRIRHVFDGFPEAIPLDDQRGEPVA